MGPSPVMSNASLEYEFHVGVDIPINAKIVIQPDFFP